jgi:metal-responsive CopG/Arc/MetJ family transcriptional regulator
MDAEPKDQRVPVMMSVSEVRAVDAWRRNLEGIPSRSEAIRQLVAAGLKAAPKPTPKAKPRRTGGGT